jgi:glutamyl-tRNA reductase
MRVHEAGREAEYGLTGTEEKLERAAISGDTLTKLLTDLVQAESLAEAYVVSTCNRVEVYADVDRFHEGVTATCELLARHCGVPAQELTPYLTRIMRAAP